MPKTSFRLIGKLVGDDGDVVWVYQNGRDYRISHNDRNHTCHPSVRDIDGVKAEAFLVFHADVNRFERAD